MILVNITNGNKWAVINSKLNTLIPKNTNKYCTCQLKSNIRVILNYQNNK